MDGQIKNSESLKNKCLHCGRSFARDTTLISHPCEPRRRHQQRNEVGVRLGFRCFQLFYELTSASKNIKTHNEFDQSPYYLAFVKFGRYLEEIHAVDPESFCRWLIKNNKKIDHWCHDRVYQEFLLFHLVNEPIDSALERSIKTMTRWADTHQSRFQDYFKYANDSRICFDIQRGQLSAWVIYASATGQEFLTRIDTVNLESIWDYVNSETWQKLINKKPKDFEWAQTVLEQAAL
jgi:hypothetical protein